MIGKTVSHYKLIKKLGAGGMGVVYKAEDQRLKRTVALKFLPQAFSFDPAVKKRFFHEAQIISALDHVNIGTVYDIDESEEGQIFLAMAYYDGESLKSRLRKGKFSQEEVLKIVIQIAYGLDKAHDQGIIHRDIKPGNILITKEGIVKIIDFGLAKYAGETGMTRSGSTLGTLAYMSPEQVQNEQVDERTDIWSLGVLFYEMLTGKLPFDGDNEAALIYAILTKEPDNIQEQEENLNRIAKTLLEKNPEKRYKKVHDFLDDLVDTGNAEPSDLIEKNQIKQRGALKFRFRKPVWLILSSVVLLFILSVILYDLGFIDSEVKEPMITKPVANMDGQEIYPAFSPDEKKIAYSWSPNREKRQFSIYVKFIDIGSPLRLTNSSGDDYSPVWSPDGTMIAFARQSYEEELNGIFITPALGGPEKKLTSMSRGYWMQQKLCWSPNGKYILFCREVDKAGSALALYKYVIESGEVIKITDPPEGIVGDFWSAISPDGQKIAFLRQKSMGENDIYVCSVSGEDVKQISFNSSGFSGITWTRDNREIIFYGSSDGSDMKLWRIAASGGTPRPMLGGGAHPDISGTGKKVVFRRGYMRQNLWKLELTAIKTLKSEPIKITNMNSIDFGPHISHDNRKIVFSSNQSGSREIWICDISGNHPVRLTNFIGPECGSPKWSSDGQSIAFDSRPHGHSDIFIILENGVAQERLTTLESDEVLPVWSNDGKWIYFSSNRTGRYEIWKISLENRQWLQVTYNGGLEVSESIDRKYIYYTKSHHSELWRMEISNGYEELFLDRYIVMANWILTKYGVFLITNDVNNKALLEFYDFQTKEMTVVASLGPDWTQFMTISADQKTIIYSQIGHWESDIFITENFDEQ